jgi:hypothetical protein
MDINLFKDFVYKLVASKISPDDKQFRYADFEVVNSIFTNYISKGTKP